MKRIYIAGPYSNTLGKELGTFHNIRAGIRKATELMLRGYAPFCAWTDFHYTLMLRDGEELSVEKYYKTSLAWLEVSDAVLLLPGWEHSKGTALEIERANALGIPVFTPEEEDAMYDFFEVLKEPYVEAEDFNEAIQP